MMTFAVLAALVSIPLLAVGFPLYFIYLVGKNGWDDPFEEMVWKRK